MKLSLNLIRRASELINEIKVSINAKYFIEFDEELSQIKLVYANGQIAACKPYFEVFE